MKRIKVSAALLVFILSSATAFAHPPSDIIITYDPASRILTAVIIHNVSNPDSHYIKKVDVGLSGKEIIEHQISRQDDSQKQTATYLIPDTKKGDTVSVEAYCSISGRLEKEITVK